MRTLTALCAQKQTTRNFLKALRSKAFKKFLGLVDLQQLPFLLGHKTQIVKGGAKRRLSLFGFCFVLIKVAKAI
jgi:hypothetical protein